MGSTLTAERLAALLHEELEADDWGDIEPHWFKLFADGETDDLNISDEAVSLGDVLERVVERVRDEDWAE
jgi:hypothetical protein